MRRNAGRSSGRILQSCACEIAISGTRLTPNPDATRGENARELIGFEDRMQFYPGARTGGEHILTKAVAFFQQ